MTSNKCTVCFHQAVQVPIEYRQVLNDLIAVFVQGISSRKLEVNDAIKFCSSCRKNLVKFAKLKEKLTSSVKILHDQFDKGVLVRVKTVKQRLRSESTTDVEDPPGCRKDSGNESEIRCISIEDDDESIHEDDANPTDPVKVTRTEDDRNHHKNKSTKSSRTGLRCAVDPLEDNWVPKNATEEQLLKEVKQVSEKEYLFRGKYSFARTDFTFKCGSCPVKSKICLKQGLPAWYDAVRHIKSTHTIEDPPGCREDSGNESETTCTSIEDDDESTHEDDANPTAPVKMTRTEDDRNHHKNKSTKSSRTGLKCAVDPLEDNWVPKNATEEQMLKEVKQVSEKEYLFRGKYSFERTDFTFKCGSCPVKSKICLKKGLPAWYDAVTHIKSTHAKSRIRKRKTIDAEFVEIAPNRFKYGNFIVEKFDDDFRCEVCGHFSPIGPRIKFRSIALHIERTHKYVGKSYMCEVCGAQFRTPELLKCHRRYQHERPDDPHSCSTCGKTYKNRLSLTQHEKMVHDETCLKYMCEICGKNFKSSVKLKDHIMVLHKGQKFECRDCEKSFSTRIALSTHENSHTGRKKYVCDICGMNFTQSYSIKRHKQTAHN